MPFGQSNEDRGPMVGRRCNSRKLFGVVVLAVAALAFGGCDWTMFGYDGTLTHSSADNAINGANVSSVQQLFTNGNTSSDEYGSPVESNGIVYVGDSNGGLDAYDANGVTNCSGTPNQCSPLWTGSTPPNSTLSSPAVVNGVVYIVSQLGSTLSAFDANGITNCSGTPKACQPLWTASTSTGEDSSVLVANGVVYIGGIGSNPGRVEAFDASGVSNCAGTPKTCQPLWTSSSNVGFSSPAVANGVLYAMGEDANLYAFSANGTRNCSGTPTICVPLWTAAMGSVSTGTIQAWSPSVSNGIVYGQSPSGLYAFDANGVTNCSGTPTTCSPLWTAPLGAAFSDYPVAPAVANGIVYAANETTLEAFDASGVTNCSGTPKSCQPLWGDNVSTISSPSIANGLVFVSQFQYGPEGLVAFDAGGVTNCSGTPKTCQPLWTGPTPWPATGSPAIANGKVYDTELDPNPFGPRQAELYAWVLPPPTSFVALPSNGDTVSGSRYLDSGASAGVTTVQYELTGGSLNHTVIAKASATNVGWLAVWNSTTVPNGSYTLQSVASYGGEVTGISAGITITVSN
jgi:PQQ-like domain